MKTPKPLESLIPLDDLKKVITGLIAVPKDALAKRIDKSTPKRG